MYNEKMHSGKVENSKKSAIFALAKCATPPVLRIEL